MLLYWEQTVTESTLAIKILYCLHINVSCTDPPQHNGKSFYRFQSSQKCSLHSRRTADVSRLFHFQAQGSSKQASEQAQWGKRKRWRGQAFFALPSPPARMFGSLSLPQYSNLYTNLTLCPKVH